MGYYCGQHREDQPEPVMIGPLKFYSSPKIRLLLEIIEEFKCVLIGLCSHIFTSAQFLVRVDFCKMLVACKANSLHVLLTL